MNELDITLKTVEQLLKWRHQPSQIKVVDGEEREVVEIRVNDIQDLINLLRYGDRE